MTNKVIWNYCSSCGRSTKNTILFNRGKKEVDEKYDFEYGLNVFLVLECNGCETISFRKEYHNFLEFDNEGKQEIEVKLYPSVLQNHKPINSYYLPAKIKDVYNHTILALKGESKLLAGVGFRAIIEAICIEENIKGRNLEQKINNLTKNRFITEKESERLHSIRFLGNDSIHKMEIPEQKKLLIVLNIIEHLLKNIYLIDRDAKGVLDTIIKTYPDFEELVKDCARKIKIGEKKTLSEILGKHSRRIPVDISIFEKGLLNRIAKNEVEFLATDNSKNENGSKKTKQVYIIREVVDEFPF